MMDPIEKSLLIILIITIVITTVIQYTSIGSVCRHLCNTINMFSEIGDNPNIELFASNAAKVFRAGDVNTRSALANSILDGLGCGSGSKWLVTLFKEKNMVLTELVYD